MRVNGNAFKVDIYQPDGTIKTIQMGATFEKMKVIRLVAGVENQLTHIRISGTTHERHMTLQGAEVQIEWAEPPNIQSQTEWTLWLAEAVGHLTNRKPLGIEDELQKFYLAEKMPNKEEVPAGDPKAYQPIPLQGTAVVPAPQTTKLHVVNQGDLAPEPGPGNEQGAVPPVGTPTDQVGTYMKLQARGGAKSVSSTKQLADSDAGGPEGFDPEEAATPVAVPEPIAILPVAIGPVQNGARMIMIKKTGQEVELKGRQVAWDGLVQTVTEVGLGQHEGEEVLCLTVR